MAATSTASDAATVPSLAGSAIAAAHAVDAAASATPLRDSLPSGAELGIDLTTGKWLPQSLEWGVSFRTALAAKQQSSKAATGKDDATAAAPVASFRLATTLADFEVAAHFVRSLAAFEKEPEAAATGADVFFRDASGSSPLVAIVLASLPVDAPGVGEAAAATPALTAAAPEGPADVAFAMYTTAYSSWKGRCLYLEDLFVDPAVRRCGLGKQLVCIGAAAAEASRCARVVWVALNWNAPALALYDRLGAERQTEWTTLRIDAEATAKAAVLD
jgi:GNAT superfamily N-acetyltransferase